MFAQEGADFGNVVKGSDEGPELTAYGIRGMHGKDFRTSRWAVGEVNVPWKNCALFVLFAFCGAVLKACFVVPPLGGQVSFWSRIRLKPVLRNSDGSIG